MHEERGLRSRKRRGLVDLEDGNRFVPVMETRAWNFQEAAMAHWLPNEKDAFVVNDFRDGNFVSGDGYWDKNFYRHWKRSQPCRRGGQ